MTDAPLTVLMCYGSPDEQARVVDADGSGVKADLFRIPP